MSRILTLFGLFISLLFSQLAWSAPKTVDKVDLDRFMGTWHTISAFPSKNQKVCRCDTITFTKPDEGDITITTQCIRKDSKRMSSRNGTVSPIEGSQNSKLRVYLFWPLSGQFWILKIDPEYQYALVGSPNYKKLWIFSRKSTLDPAIKQTLLDYAKQQGYTVENMVMLDQDCSKP
jgi:apolipoprotein D and lipocalin family protein